MNEFLEHWLVNEWFDEHLYNELYPKGIRIGVNIGGHIISRVKERISKKLSENIIFEALDRWLRLHEISKFPWLATFWNQKLRNSPPNSVAIFYNHMVFIFKTDIEKDKHGEFPTLSFITCIRINLSEKKEFENAWKKLRKTKQVN